MKEIVTDRKNPLVSRFRKWWRYVTAAGALFFLGCANISGGGSEAGNARITGRVMDTQGSPAGNVMVRIMPSDFDPVKDAPVAGAFTDTTAADGAYRFTVAEGRTYTIEAVHTVMRTRALVAFVEAQEADNTAPRCTLNAPGAVKVMPPAGLDTASGYMYIPGTTFFGSLDKASGYVMLDSIPAGIVPSILYSSKNSAVPFVMRRNITMLPGDTVTIAYSDWVYSKRLLLNTSASGANVQADVYGFPVLVRLTTNTFDFSQAKTNGEDIRFSKSDSTPLPYEIERWDASIGHAEIWVRTDTVFGNDSIQSITMYWGNPAATSRSEGNRVFDTAEGFQDVWHLGDISDTTRDATENRCYGIGYGNLSRSPCAIGFGRTFNGAKTYYDMGNVFNPGGRGFTISAWIKRGSTVGIRAIMAKSEGGSPSSGYGWNLSFGASSQLQCFIASGGSNWGESGAFDFWSGTDAAVVDTATWHYIAAVVDRSNNKNSRTYIDGIDVTDSCSGDISAVGSLVNSLPLRIGAESDGDCQWIGSIDECVISYAVRPEAWIRLCYGNQVLNDRLVKFR